MYHYDPESRVLRIQKIREPELDSCLAQFQHDSYNIFCNRDVYEILLEVIKKFGETIHHNVTVEYNPKAPADCQRPHNFYVERTTDPSWKMDIRAWPNRYTPIMANLNVDGAVYKNVEIFRLPYMTEEGILNIDGNRRICGLQMTTANGLSYDGAGKLNLSIPDRNIAMDIGTSNFAMKAPDKTSAKWKVIDVAIAYMVTEGIDIDLEDLFTSVYARTILTAYHYADKSDLVPLSMGVRVPSTDYNTALAQHPTVYETYHRTYYRLDKSARDSLNLAMSIDRAETRTLSRDVYSHDGQLLAKAGEVVTRPLLNKFKRGLVNVLYVKTRPNLRGYKAYTQSGFLMVSEIPAGAPITEDVRAVLPDDLKQQTHARKTIRFDRTLPERMETQGDIRLPLDNIFIDLDAPLTDDVIDLLSALNYTKLIVSPGGDKWFEASFEEEIVGNYMIRLGDAVGPQAMHSGGYSGRDRNEWVYFYNNPTLAPTPEANEYLTTWDWLGLVGLASYIWAHPTEHNLQDRDTGMLKRIEGPNEIFSRALRQAIPQTFAIQKSWINAVSTTKLVGPSFYPLYKNWLRVLNRSKALIVEPMQNPVQMMSHVRQVDVAHGLKEVADAQRMLSPGYYGRIDPYETPAGKKLGLTNTLALGARIDPETGKIKTPYIKLRKDGRPGKYTQVYLDDQCEVRWLDAQEEVRYTIGDKLSLDRDEGTGIIRHSTVVARVPNSQKTGHVIESVDSWQLDYVNYHCVQHLSVTSALVPFVGADESARMTLGASMVKQSILVQYNERPRLYTSVYRHLINSTPSYCVKAEEDGLVVLVNTRTIEYVSNPAEVAYGSKVPMVVMTQLRETYHNSIHQVRIPTNVASRNTVNIVHVYVRPGQWVKKGDILYASSMACDGVYSPGCNLLTAYIPDGYSYEDAVEVSERATQQLTSISIESQKIKLDNRHTQMPDINIFMDSFVLEGDPVATFSDSTNELPSETHHSGMHTGIVYSVKRDTSASAKSYSDYEAIILAFNKMRVGDKLIGRHSNKGTSSIVRKNSEMPRFLNGIQCDVVLNPLGVPSRLNLGQNYEAWLGFVADLLDIYIESDSFNGATRSEVAELMSYIYDLANAADPKAVTSKYSGVLPMSLLIVGEERFDKVRIWAGCFNKDGTAWLINPVSGKRYGTPVTFGKPYFLKLEHEVSRKIKARAGLPDGELYTKIHQQPVEGGARGGGERVGEMEMVALAAYGANDLVRETLNEDSDNIVERIRSAAMDLGRLDVLRAKRPQDTFDVAHAVPYAVEHFRYLLEVLGIGMDGDFLPSCDDAYAQHRVVPAIESIILGQTEDDIGARGDDLFTMVAGSGTGANLV